MKKVMAILMMVMTVPAFATTMCAVDDSVAVVLDPTIGGSGYTYDNTAGTWKTTFSYGYVSGISACLNSNKGKGMGGWVANLTDVNPDGEEKTVVGSEKYGRYCWCKATHPVASRWVFNYDNGSASFALRIARTTVATSSGTPKRCAWGCLARFRNDVPAKCRGAERRGTKVA